MDTEYSFKDPLRRPPTGPFREGDRVRLFWGVTPVEGVVIEDHGNIGVGGRRFYRVRFQIDEFSEPMELAEPADELTLVARAPKRSRNGRPRRKR